MANFADDLLEQFAQVNRTTKDRDLSNREIVLILGNTGAGKSTFTNYIMGKQMREAQVQGSLRKGFICDDAVVEIGHGFESKTAYPHTVYDHSARVTYCDCPGFLDTRSVLHDLSNTYAIAKVAKVARAIKGVVYVMSYHSLSADRGRAVESMMLMLQSLFAGKAEYHLHSVMLLVTKVPVDTSVEMLRDHLLEKDSSSVMLQTLLQQLLIYDPLDRHCSSSLGWVDRANIVRSIRAFDAFPGEDLQLSLSPSVEEDVVTALSALKNSIFRGPAVVNLLSPNVHSAITSLMKALRKLSVFDSGAIQKVENGVGETMSNCLFKMIPKRHPTSNIQAIASLQDQLKKLKNIRDMYQGYFDASIAELIASSERGIKDAKEKRAKQQKLEAERERAERERCELQRQARAAEDNRRRAAERERLATAAREEAERVQRQRRAELEESERQRRAQHYQAQQQQLQQMAVLQFLVMNGFRF
jgi:hypothetical protein